MGRWSRITLLSQPGAPRPPTHLGHPAHTDEAQAEALRRDDLCAMSRRVRDSWCMALTPFMVMEWPPLSAAASPYKRDQPLAVGR